MSAGGQQRDESTSELPGPPIPADVDLSDFPYTPIFRARLFGSSFHAHANDSEWRAGVTLWLKSWDQVPAGSLPNDDVELCRLAELGRELDEWRRVKERAMHGWFLCSDGRLYHPVVAECALEAHERRMTASNRGKAGASSRWSKGNASALRKQRTRSARANGASNAHASHEHSSGKAEAMLADGKRIEGKGREETRSEEKGNQNQKQKPESEGARATRLPSDFVLTAERRQVAEAERLDAERTFAKFCNYWRSASGARARKIDWEATWRNWCLTEADRNGGRPNGRSPGHGNAQLALQTAEQLEDVAIVEAIRAGRSDEEILAMPELEVAPNLPARIRAKRRLAEGGMRADH